MKELMCSMLLANANLNETQFMVLSIVKIALLIVMALCALFIIVVVLFQPGNSSGVGALGGQTETFLSKNKGKTRESKLKKMTVVSFILLAVISITFAILQVVLG